MRVAPVIGVAKPSLLGVLAWWGVMLTAPAVLFRRLWRCRSSRALRPEVGGTTPETPSGPSLPVPSYCWPGTSSDLPTDGKRSGSGSDVRLRPGTLEPLCRYVDFRRRLEPAVAELHRRLSVLRRDGWRVEPYPLTGDRRNTVLILGRAGVFVVSATYAPGQWDDVVAVGRMAEKIQLLLPGYPGQVQPAICHPFTAVEPRVWHRADERGEWVWAWLVGGDRLIEWLDHFGGGYALGRGDLERFDELAEPSWLRPAIAASLTWPPLLGRPSANPRE